MHKCALEHRTKEKLQVLRHSKNVHKAQMCTCSHLCSVDYALQEEESAESLLEEVLEEESIMNISLLVILALCNFHF